MKRIYFDAGWTFRLGPRDRWRPEREALVKEIPVTLPHDFTISTDPRPDAPGQVSAGYYAGGYGIYTKEFSLPEDMRGQTVLLSFDGAYRNCEVVINGQLVASHPYGYTAFQADLTGHLWFDRPNRVEVTVNNTAEPNSRWYSGSGIYRSVELLTAPPLHIAPWGIFARTDCVDGGTGHLVVEITVDNATDQDADVWITTVLTDLEGQAAASGKTLVTVPTGSSGKGTVPLTVPNAQLWELDTPTLYQVRSEISEDGTILDTAETSFGIRTISIDPRQGFRLNGQQMKLRGGCIHHDNGLLGAAAFRDSEFRKVKIHKDNGYNALRCAHNPPSQWLLEACDRLGILVMDEAFDMWRTAKTINDYHLHFEDWWERDLHAMVLRDRNHPSVFCWSIGNEIPERDGSSNGAAWSRRLAEAIRAFDPTRPVTSAVNPVIPPPAWDASRPADETPEQRAEALLQYGDEKTSDFVASLDLVGYNYLDGRYERDGKLFPHRVICGTESFPLDSDIVWDRVERLPHVIGDFLWTSYDYLGEAGLGKVVYGEEARTINQRFMSHVSAFPWRVANCSDFDLCGFERPQLAYRKIVWGSGEPYISVRNPAHYGQPEAISSWGWPDCISHWNWAGYEGKPVSVEVYSATARVALFLNGTKIGESPAGKENRYKAVFDILYQPGELLAVGLNTDGTECSRHTIRTTGAPVGIRLTPDRPAIDADGHALCYVLVEMVDERGDRVPDAEIETTAEVTGPATLAALGAARLATTENFTTGRFTTYEGRLQAILRAGTESGTAVLTVRSGVWTASTEVLVE